MIEKIWNITSVDEKIASNGNPYIVVNVMGDDGKPHKNPVFDQSMFPIFKGNQAVKVSLDKPEGSTRWQVKAVAPASESIPPPRDPAKAEIPQQPEIDKAREAVQDPRQKDIQYQVALKEIGELYRAGFLTTDDPVERKLIAKYKNWLCTTMNISVEHH